MQENQFPGKKKKLVNQLFYLCLPLCHDLCAYVGNVVRANVDDDQLGGAALVTSLMFLEYESCAILMPGWPLKCMLMYCCSRSRLDQKISDVV